MPYCGSVLTQTKCIDKQDNTHMENEDANESRTNVVAKRQNELPQPPTHVFGTVYTKKRQRWDSRRPGTKPGQYELMDSLVPAR